MFINTDGAAVRLLMQDEQSRVWFCDWADDAPDMGDPTQLDAENPPAGVNVLPSFDFFSKHREATREEVDNPPKPAKKIAAPKGGQSPASPPA